MPGNYSVGIAAYNEQENIGELLHRLSRYGADSTGLAEIIVVASGCTDGTEAIVRSCSAVDGRIRLITEPRRAGKASAVNLFIENSASDLLVLMGADILPGDGALGLLTAPFSDPGVGVTAGRILPVNDRTSLMGYYVNLFWSLHHQIGLQSFKAGEVVAFRKVFTGIPADTATDETWIVQQTLRKGYRSEYVPRAVFTNRGPDNIRDFLKVRRRHLLGYYHLLTLRPGWKLPDTMNNLKVLKLVAKGLPFKPRDMAYLAGSVFLELWARMMARYDYYLAGKNPYVWEIASSTKHLRATR